MMNLGGPSHTVYSFRLTNTRDDGHHANKV